MAGLFGSSGSADPDLEGSKAPLIEHLIELRNRLMYSVIALFICFIGAYLVAEHIYAFLVAPLASIYAEMGVENPRMIYTALHAAVFTYLKLAFWTAVFGSFPVMASQLWMFVAPGLYKNERMAFMPFLVATPLLFVAGAALVYYFIFPLAWRFFIGFQPVAAIAAALPISVGGLGVREGVLVELFGGIGVEESLAFATSILGYGAGILASLLGGILFIVRRIHPVDTPAQT